MSKVKPINGWTKKSMIAHIKKNFKGQSIKRSSDDDMLQCLYRGPKGKKCAVGLFIPDCKYNSNMETNAASAVIMDYSLKQYMPLAAFYMGKLQFVHDNANKKLSNAKILANMIAWINENVA